MIDTHRVKAATIRETLMGLALQKSATGALLDPTEVARAIAGKDEKVWRRLMKPIKDEVARLAEAGEIVILRKGQPVAPDRIRGLYRVRLLKEGEEKPVFAAAPEGTAKPRDEDDDDLDFLDDDED